MLESKLHLDRLVRLEKLRNLQLLSFCLSLIGVDIAIHWDEELQYFSNVVYNIVTYCNFLLKLQYWGKKNNVQIYIVTF